jgi:hypothetical protein
MVDAMPGPTRTTSVVLFLTPCLAFCLLFFTQGLAKDVAWFGVLLPLLLDAWFYRRRWGLGWWWLVVGYGLATLGRVVLLVWDFEILLRQP